MVEPLEVQREVAYAKLRTRVLRAALRQGIPQADAEDFAHDVLESTLREVLRPGAPTLEVRVGGAIRDETADYWRRARRRPPVLSLTLPRDERGLEEERPELAVDDSMLAIVELREVIAAIAGDDAMRYAFLKTMRATERDIALILEWSPQRTAAARVQLGRKKPEIARVVSNFYGSKNERRSNG